MSNEDRERWDQRYGDGAYESRTHPSALLERWIHRLPSGRALDVACGAGRNTLWLAARGYAVVATDISAVALDRLARHAGAGPIRTVVHDLDRGLPEIPGLFDMILKMRYLNLALLPQLVERLAHGGVLVCEVLLQDVAGGAGAVVGPQGPRFRAAPGALLAAARPLELLHYDEGPVADPDGRTVRVARLIGRRL